MDLRKKKTLRAISEAFCRIRRQKDLEQITVTELAQSAEISKATFYLHYRDIYDLSSKLQERALQSVFSRLEDPMEILTDSHTFMRKLVAEAEAEADKIEPLFSGSQAAALPLRIEAGLRERIFCKAPQLEQDPLINVYLSYHIQGGYYAYSRNVQAFGTAGVFDSLEKIHSSYTDIFKEAYKQTR